MTHYLRCRRNFYQLTTLGIHGMAMLSGSCDTEFETKLVSPVQAILMYLGSKPELVREYSAAQLALVKVPLIAASWRPKPLAWSACEPDP